MSISASMCNIQSTNKLFLYVEIIQHYFAFASHSVVSTNFFCFWQFLFWNFFQVWLSYWILRIRISELFTSAFSLASSRVHSCKKWNVKTWINGWLTCLLKCGLWLSFLRIFHLLVLLPPQESDICIISQAVDSFFRFQILPVFSSHSPVAH